MFLGKNSTNQGKTKKAKTARRKDHKGENTTPRKDQKGENSTRRKDHQGENSTPRKVEKGNTAHEGRTTKAGTAPRKDQKRKQHTKAHQEKTKKTKTAHQGRIGETLMESPHISSRGRQQQESQCFPLTSFLFPSLSSLLSSPLHLHCSLTVRRQDSGMVFSSLRPWRINFFQICLMNSLIGLVLDECL